MSFALIDTHGSAYALHPSLSGEGTIRRAELEGQAGEALRKSIVPGGWVVLNACSTGKENDGVAAILSRRGLRVVAPPIAQGLRKVDVTGDEKTGIRLSPDYGVSGKARGIISQTFIDGKRIADA